jgi:hypothetical protein
VDHKHNKIKQSHKEGRALRTETTINDSRDFNIGKRLCNLPELAQVGFSANRRLLDVERLSSDPTIGEGAFRSVGDPIVVDEQRRQHCRSTPLAPRRCSLPWSCSVCYPMGSETPISGRSWRRRWASIPA